MPLTYMSGEEIRKGDSVLYHGEPAEIEFVADSLIPDPETDWYVEEFGGGVMVRDPSCSGFTFLNGPEKNSRLEFVCRAALRDS